MSIDFSSANIDTFSPDFTADQFALPDDFVASPTNINHNSQSVNSPKHNSKTTKSSASPQNTTQVNGTSGPKLNPRSCVTCRRRKVRCDKQEPCTNCQKAGIECIFPSPGRAPRKSKKPPDAELLARLRRLEGVVQKLGKNGDGEDITASDLLRKDSLNEVNGKTSPSNDTTSNTKVEPHCMKGPQSPQERLDRFQQFHEVRGQESGRMVVGEGRSRYVSNSFWAGLTEEIAEMRDLLHYSSSEDEPPDGATPSSVDTTGGRLSHQEFIFGYSSTMTTLRILHPPAKQIMTYWQLYTTNVDPVVRILHKPTIEKLFQQAAIDQSSIPKSSEPLVFAIYLAVVTSLRPEECQSILQIDKETALKRYRYATEQAFAKASFLTSQEIVVVASFTLFLTCVRKIADNGEVWMLTGLLLRMAHSLGLHRDGAQFGLSPYDTEIRRRLWWQVCTLDVRASEDQGSEPMITERFFDTKLPSNINDSDIWPGMKDPPVEHEGCTEMTFDLVRYEIGGTIRLLSALSKCPKESKSSEHDQLEAKEAALERLRLKLEDKYLRHCDMGEPLQWVAANVSRLVMAKIWLVIHHPFRRGAFGAKIAQETRDRTFLTSVDVIRYARLLETQQKTLRWGWLFQTYRQWHALAFLLAELCMRSKGPAVEDAWKVVEEAWPAWDAEHVSSHITLWKPIVRLMQKARAVRQKELDRRNTFPTDGTLGPVSNHNTPDSNGIGSIVTPTSNLGLSNPIVLNEAENVSTDAIPNISFYPDMNMDMNKGFSTMPTENMNSLGMNSTISQFTPANPLTDLNTFTHDMTGLPSMLNDPVLQNDPLLDTNIDWAAWDAEMGMDFQNEMTQPMNLDMEQLWGGPQ